MDTVKPFQKTPVLQILCRVGLLAALLSLPACGVESSRSGQNGGQGKGVQITSISPDAGPLFGATVVQIKGSNLAIEGQETLVYFGETAAEIREASPDMLLVISPVSTVTGPVDISVLNALGKKTQTGAFTYDDAVRQFGALAELRKVMFPRGDLFQTPQVDLIEAEAAFVSPVTLDIIAPDLPLDTCIYNWDDGTSDVGEKLTLLNFGDSVSYASGDGVVLPLSYNPASAWPDDIAPYSGAGSAYGNVANFKDSWAYDVTASGGTPELAQSVTLSDAIATPDSFSVDMPDLTRDITNLDVVSRTNGVAFQWTANPTLDSEMFIIIEDTPDDPSELPNEILCQVTDDGQFQVPASLVANFPTQDNKATTITVFRRKQQTWGLPSGATGYSFGVTAVIGVARME